MSSNKKQMRKVKRTKDRRGVLMYLLTSEVDYMKTLSNYDITKYIIQYLTDALPNVTEDENDNFSPDVSSRVRDGKGRFA